MNGYDSLEIFAEIDHEDLNALGVLDSESRTKLLTAAKLLMDYEGKFIHFITENIQTANMAGDNDAYCICKYLHLNCSCLMPRSHIHGSPRRFYYGLNLKDDPGNANFRSPIRMHYIRVVKFYYV